MAVVAGALRGADGRWLMHQRPPGKAHPGLWEFPGGKVESGEMPAQSLVRELCEELAIRCSPSALSPVGFAESSVTDTTGAIVILLYTLRDWEGVPRAVEGGAVGWFTPDEIRKLPRPPLDIELTNRLFQNL